MLGIDVSVHNAAVNFKKVKAAGFFVLFYKFVFYQLCKFDIEPQMTSK